MNVAQIVNLVVRLLLRKLIKRGANARTGMAPSRGRGATASDPQAKPADAAQAKASRALVKRARQAARLTRRL